jgi:hypothetical protein
MDLTEDCHLITNKREYIDDDDDDDYDENNNNSFLYPDYREGICDICKTLTL